MAQRGIPQGMVFAAFVAPFLLGATMRFVDAAAGLPDTELALITCDPKTGRDVSDDAAAKAMAARDRTDREVERRDDSRQVRGALDQLPAEQRRVIELAYFGGFTHTEIAALLGLADGTVKGRIRLGLQKLRAEYEPIVA